MRKLLFSSISLLTALTLLEPAMADGFEKPKKQRATSPARATQPARVQTASTQSANWSGSQAGGSNGASSVNNNFVEPGAYNFFPGCGGPCYETPFQASGNKASYTIGGFLGYRHQVGNFVVGVEGDIYWKNGETSKVQNTPPPWLQYETFTGSQKQGMDGSLRLRVGALVTPWTLIYATGGIAIGQVTGSFSYYGADFGGNAVYGASSWSDTRVGGTVGAGVETEVWSRVKARAEYRYTNLGSYSKDVPLANNVIGCGVSCGTSAHIDLRATNQRFTVGLGVELAP